MPSPLASLKHAHLRIARPTDRLEEVVEFYQNCLGFEIVGSFEGHSGIDGVMLGHAESGYHLEFTTMEEHTVGDAPTKDHLLVFYLPDPNDWRAVTQSIELAGGTPVEAFNPYWAVRGKTYADPDGYRIVIQNASWPTTAE